MTPCSLVDRKIIFEVFCYCIALWNAGVNLPSYTASHVRKSNFNVHFCDNLKSCIGWCLLSRV